MTHFNQQRLTQETLQLDLDGLRRGQYSDNYFENIRRLLDTLSAEGYSFKGVSPRLKATQTAGYPVGDAVVEMQIFPRRKPWALVGGVDVALVMLRHCVGEFDAEGRFINRTGTLEVEAVQDGVTTAYDGDPQDVRPVLKIRGPYRYFAHLETPMLGYLTRISRIATNVYHTLVAARGKPVLYFPARFDLPAVQAADGYAYYLAVQRYNHDHQADLQPAVSTDAQGRWWGGSGGGTVPHALLASFLADTAESMVQYARVLSTDVPRIALVDFENDCITTSVQTARALFSHYMEHQAAGRADEAEKFRLDGVRLDTGSDLIDRGLTPVDDPSQNYNVNPRLVRAVRQALDSDWQQWDDLPADQHAAYRDFCQAVQIVCTGGFDADKITRFEENDVPADVYGVGSAFMRNGDQYSTDFTADVVRVRVGETWYPLAKVGRQPCENPDLATVDL